MARSTESVALTVMTISEVPNFWSGFLPSLFTIATFSGGDEKKVAHTKQWIRKGEIQAMGLTIALGIAASVLVEEPWPLVGVLIMGGYLALQYEMALSKGSKAGPGMNMAAPVAEVATAIMGLA